MIIPNLMVSDVDRSFAFYRDTLGLTPVMAVTASREMRTDGTSEGAVFAIFEWDSAQLMLQAADSLAQELPLFGPSPTPSPGGTIYFRGLDPDALVTRVDPAHLIKGPETSWYGMRELYLRDPDGHVLCAGVPFGPAPGAEITQDDGAEA